MRIDFAPRVALLRAMRFFLLLLCAVTLRAAAPEAPAAVPAKSTVPAELATAMKRFRTDAPKGWSFTLATVGGGESRVERFDAAQAEIDRWALVQKDGRPATTDEKREYYELHTRRSRNGTAPNLLDQLDLGHLEIIADDATHATYRCKLEPGEKDDSSAEFMRVTLQLHKPSNTIESFTISSTGPFSPALGVKIAEMSTQMTYTLPVGDTPSLPKLITTRLRGRAFFVKSLDADLTATYSDFVKATAAKK